MRENREAIHQVFAQLAVAHCGLRIAVGRGDDARRRRCISPSPPTRVKRPVSSTRSRRTCMSGAISVISSSNSVPPSARSKQPRCWRRAGERALLVAEELGLDQVGRNRAAVDGDERSATAFAAIVDRPGDELLAAAGFADDEHCCRRGRNFLDIA